MAGTEVGAELINTGCSFFGIIWSYYLLCGIGAFVLFFKLQKKGSPIFEVIGYLNPKWADSPFCRFFEALLFAVLGAIIGTIITQPGNPQQAIAAGLGWTGLLSKTTDAN